MRGTTTLGLVFVAVLACGTPAAGGPVPSSSSVSTATGILPRCPSGARPQTELDFAGLPPFVVSRPPVKCLLNAWNGGTPYDAPYDASIQLTDGRVLHLYERRGGLQLKPGQTPQRQGVRDVGGVSWMWAILQGPTASLTNMVNGVYVELDLPGDESQLDTLTAIAADLRPVESFSRSSARDICATLHVSINPITVAAAFDSTAAAVARWQETPETTAGPHTTESPHTSNSAWRQHPMTEPVAVCYLDGDFGTPKGAPPGPGTTAAPLPNWDRVVYLVGVDRHPIGVVYGWRDRIAIRDPGR